MALLALVSKVQDIHCDCPFNNPDTLWKNFRGCFLMKEQGGEKEMCWVEGVVSVVIDEHLCLLGESRMIL